MSQPIPSLLIATRRQIRRLRGITLVSVVSVVAATALLLKTPGPGWLGMVLLLGLAGYLYHKVRQVFWARRALKQLCMEEQFVRHGPAPEKVVTCIRRGNHLWTHSLTLKGLKALLTAAPEAERTPPHNRGGVARAPLRQHYQRSFGALRPSSLPVGLIWLAALMLLWLWSVPEALLSAPTAWMLAGGAWLFVALGAEVVQTLLLADVRDGFDQFTDLLTDWTLTQPFEAALRQRNGKHYRHTLLYRAPDPAAPLPTPLHDESLFEVA